MFSCLESSGIFCPAWQYAHATGHEYIKRNIIDLVASYQLWRRIDWSYRRDWSYRMLQLRLFMQASSNNNVRNSSVPLIAFQFPLIAAMGHVVSLESNIGHFLFEEEKGKSSFQNCWQDEWGWEAWKEAWFWENLYAKIVYFQITNEIFITDKFRVYVWILSTFMSPSMLDLASMCWIFIWHEKVFIFQVIYKCSQRRYNLQ